MTVFSNLSGDLRSKSQTKVYLQIELKLTTFARQKVRSSNCLFGKMSIRQNVCSAKRPFSKMSFGKMSFGKVSFGKMSGHPQK
jgi:hypothetical protein